MAAFAAFVNLNYGVGGVGGTFLSGTDAFGQTYIIDSKRESARSGKLTGGITKAAFVSGDPDIKITVNVPSFQMTLWQNGNEVKTYPVGVGLLAESGLKSIGGGGNYQRPFDGSTV